MSEKRNIRLNSWKEIADYLEREVRTVSRWEKQYGLPVHRVGGGKGRSVFAYTAEIDEWLARTNPNGEPGDASSDVPAGPTRVIRFETLSRWLIAAVLVVMIAAVLFWTRSVIGADVANVRVSGGMLTAYDAGQRALWQTDFNDSDEGMPITALVDLDGNGRNDVIAFDRGTPIRYKTVARNAQFMAMSAAGRHLWTFSPEMSLKFGDQTYGGPWVGQTWTMANTSPGPVFVVAVHHFTWWPGVVIALDRAGKILGQFINSGWITSLGFLERGPAHLLLAGGISNSNDAAMLAVLDLKHPAGSSPEQSGSPYECAACSKDKPLQYFVFPRSELNRTSVSRYNQVISTDSFPDRVLVHVQEVDPVASQTYSTIESIYEFTPDMKPRGFRFGDQYWDLHRHLELEGAMSHSQAKCPDRLPRVIRSWSADSGWIEISVPPI